MSCTNAGGYDEYVPEDQVWLRSMPLGLRIMICAGWGACFYLLFIPAILVLKYGQLAVGIVILVDFGAWMILRIWIEKTARKHGYKRVFPKPILS